MRAAVMLPRRARPLVYALFRPKRGPSFRVFWTIPLVLPLVLFAPYLFGHVMPFGDDILLLNYPLLSLLAHGLRAGYPILWNPYSGGGYALTPFSALPFYPPTWLLAIMPVTTAMSWSYVLDLALAGLGMYVLAGRLGVGRAARVAPAVVFPFSGFVLAHIYAGHFLEVAVICWLPLALAALHWAADAPTTRTALRRGILCGGSLGMMILAGGVSWLVFVDYFVALVAMALAGLAAWDARRRGVGAMLGAAWLPLAALSAAVITAAMLGAIVLLPLRAMLGATVRGDAMSYQALTRISEPPLGLAMALMPGLFGSDPAHTYWLPNPDAYFQEVYIYIGLLPLALAAAGAVLGRRRRVVQIYGGLTVLGLLLALGANTPLYSAIYHVMPGLDLARVPARWLLLSVLGAAVLAGVGAEALAGAASARTAPAGRRREAARVLARARAAPLTLILLLALLALGLAGAGLTAILPRAAGHGGTIVPAVARLVGVSLVSAAAVLAAAQLPRSAGAVLLCSVTLADLWSANAILIRPLDPAPYYQGSAVDLARNQANGGRVWALDRSIPLREGMLDRRVRDVQDVAPLTLSDYWLFTHPGRSLTGTDTGMARSVMAQYDGRIAALLGVSLVMSGHPLHEPGLRSLGRVPVTHWGLLDGDWSHPGPRAGVTYAYRMAAALPFALPVYAARFVAPGQARQAILSPGFDPRRAVLLDSSVVRPVETNPILDLWRGALAPALACPPSSTGGSSVAGCPTAPAGSSFAVVGSSENGVALRGAMRQGGFLLLDQVFDNGWTATIDGKPATLRRADDILTALALPVGAHAVSLVYAPLSFLVGAAPTFAGYALLASALVIGQTRRATNYSQAIARLGYARVVRQRRYPT